MAEKKQDPMKPRNGAIVRVPIPKDLQRPVDNSAFGVGQRAGQSVRRAASAGMARTLAGAAQAPVVGPLVTAGLGLSQQPVRVAVRDFFDGIAGNPKGGKKVPMQPEKPVEQALAQGREVGMGTGVAPVDQASALLSAILGSGLTVNEASTVTGMLPQGAKAPGAKDTVMGQAAKLSEALFQSQVTAAQELEKSDPQAARDLVEKATTAHFNRQAGLVGFNPVQLAQAALMGGAEEEQ